MATENSFASFYPSLIFFSTPLRHELETILGNDGRDTFRPVSGRPPFFRGVGPVIGHGHLSCRLGMGMFISHLMIFASVPTWAEAAQSFVSSRERSPVDCMRWFLRIRIRWDKTLVQLPLSLTPRVVGSVSVPCHPCLNNWPQKTPFLTVILCRFLYGPPIK